MATEKFDLSVILSFIDKSAKGLKGFQSNMGKVGKKMTSLGKNMSMAVTAPIVALGANAVRMGSDFQNTMNMVGAVTNTTGKTFDQLKLTARGLGATTQFSARQAGEAMKFMGMAGFDANKIIAASPKVLELAAAAQLDMGTAADLTTNIMSGFSFQAKDMARVNDILVNTFTNANVSLPQMGEAMKKIGPVASKMKFRFTEVAAALGVMGNNGIQGAEAGVALRRALINLQKPTKMQQKAMRFMELEFKNADGTMKDLTGIIGEYENAAKKGASETQIMTSMMTIFGPRAVAPMLALLSAGSKGLKEMEDKTKKVGTASEIAERQMQGLPGALKLLKSAWESVNIALTEGEFGEWVETVVRGLADVLSGIGKFVKTHPEITKWGLVMTGIFAVGGPLLLGLGAAAIALGAISWPIILIAAAIAGVTAGIIALMAKVGEKNRLESEGISKATKGGLGGFRQAESSFAEKNRLAQERKEQELVTGTGGNRFQASAGFIQSKSEIRLRIDAARGISTKVEGVKKAGDTNVNIESGSNVGPTLLNVAPAGGF